MIFYNNLGSLVVLKKLFKAIAIITSFSVITRGLGFLFRIILSRYLGAEGIGVYQIAFSVFMVFETFISSGLPLALSKRVSNFELSHDKTSEQRTTTAALFLGITTAIILCLVILIFKNIFSLLFTDKRCFGILFILMPTLIVSSVYSILRGNLWGHRKYFLVSFTEFVEQLSRIIVFVLIGVFLLSRIDGFMVATISYVISCAISSLLVLIIYLKNHLSFKKPKKNEFCELLKSSSPITLVRVLSSLIMPIISIIVPIELLKIGYSNDQAMSLFGIAIGMTFPLLYIPSTLVGSLSMTLIPDISCAATQNNVDEIKNKINFSIKFSLFVSFIFIPIFYALGEQIGILIYGNVQSGIFLSNSSLLIIPICLSGVSVSCLNALNLEVRGFINYIIGAVFLILSVIFLTKYIGIMSLVVGMGLCLGIASLLNLLLLSKHTNSNFFNFFYLMKLVICSIPCILMSKWIFGLTTFLPLFFSIAISALFGELFFLIIWLIFV